MYELQKQLMLKTPSTMAQAIDKRKVYQVERKANGQGHTYKVGKSYRTVIHKDAYVVTAMAATPQESKRKAKEKLLRLPVSTYSLESEINFKIKFSEFLINWLESVHQHNIANSTFKRYMSLAIHHINPVLGDYELRQVTPRLINLLLAKMRDSGQSIRSQQQARAVLSIALTEAEFQNLISENPIRKVKNPQGKSKEISPITLDEVKRLFSTYKLTYLSARLHIALLCGLRQGEALGLRWQDLDLELGTLKVQTQIQLVNNLPIFTRLKTDRSYRTLILTNESITSLRHHKKILNEWMLKKGEDWNLLDLVFPQEDGLPRSPKTDYAEWQKALRLCGISPKRLHDARHTAATLMYSQSVGIETISRALGHSSSAITSRLYVHSSEEPLRKAAELVSVALSQK
jgi:integrase